MFIFRFIKRLLFVVVIVVVTLYVAGYEYKGKTVQARFQEARKSGLISEGFKDIKTWILELFRVGNKVAKDQLTENDKKELEDVIKNELKENVEKIKQEAQKLDIDTKKSEPAKSPEKDKKPGGK